MTHGCMVVVISRKGASERLGYRGGVQPVTVRVSSGHCDTFEMPPCPALSKKDRKFGQNSVSSGE